MLEEDFGITIPLDRVYRMMDKLDDKAVEKLNNLTYQNTSGLFQEKIDIIFFDCTTIYFESFTEDEFKRNGCSKDLKFNQTQTLLALLVTKFGLPIGYQAFSGDTYEGHTVIPIINKIRKDYDIDKVIFVADAGMFSDDNLKEIEKLGKNKIEYVVGSRLKNTPQELKEKILNRNNYRKIDENYQIGQFDYKERRLIVSYSEKRARKDSYDRMKAIEKIQKKISKQKNIKEYLSNHGSKKYLKITGESVIELDLEKIKEDSKWDGLHGVIANAEELPDKEIIEQYNNLWNVENAFCITKHDLKVCPVFHWKPERIKAHLAISFASYVLVKYLEYRVRIQYICLSPEKIRRELIKVQTSILYEKKKKIRYALPSKMSIDAKKIYKLCGMDRSLTPYIVKKL